MSRNTRPTKAFLLLLGMGFAFAGSAPWAPARAQYVYQCPPGYYYYPAYGCVLSGYAYPSPYYPYPDFGFDFLYGGGWGGWDGYRGGPRGGEGGEVGGGGHRLRMQAYPRPPVVANVI